MRISICCAGRVWRLEGQNERIITKLKSNTKDPENSLDKFV